MKPVKNKYNPDKKLRRTNAETLLETNRHIASKTTPKNDKGNGKCSGSLSQHDALALRKGVKASKTLVHKNRKITKLERLATKVARNI